MIKRKFFTDLVDHLPQKEMSLIIGPRQAGKTALMERLKEDLDNRGERTLFLNLDIEWDRPHFILVPSGVIANYHNISGLVTGGN